MVVWVDADACPKAVLQFLREAKAELGYELQTVASQNHFFDQPDHITVGPESQATDLAIVNRMRRSDVVVTQDWGLAALVLAKGGKAISPVGSIYRAEKMTLMLEQRNAMARFRRGGGRTKGPAARTMTDDRNFQQAFRQLFSES